MITDNMYKTAIDKHNKVIKSTQKHVNRRTQILLFDFDIYTQKGLDFKQSLFYVYIDSLPDYCSHRYCDFSEKCTPICIKHLDLCVLTSV